MDDRDFNLTRAAHAAPTAGSFSSLRAFARHWRESVRYFGWWRSLRETTSATWDALVEMLPSRRKARFGDLDYDWEHTVDTTRSNVGFGTQFLAGVTARPYFATEPWLFEQIMEALARSIQQSAVSQEAVAQTGLQDFTFVDLGSGKGRVLLMASDYPFQEDYRSRVHARICIVRRRRISRAIQAIVNGADKSKPSAWTLGIFSFHPGRWWCICSIPFRRRLSCGSWRIYGSH